MGQTNGRTPYRFVDRAPHTVLGGQCQYYHLRLLDLVVQIFRIGVTRNTRSNVEKLLVLSERK